jgi:hypothetical protein
MRLLINNLPALLLIFIGGGLANMFGFEFLSGATIAGIIVLLCTFTNHFNK